MGFKYLKTKVLVFGLTALLLLLPVVMCGMIVNTAMCAPEEKYELRFELLTPSYDPIRVRAGEMVAEWAAEAGIKIDAKAVDFNTLVTKTFGEHDFDMFILGWAITATPDHPYWFFHSSQDIEWGNNAPGIRNATLDELLEAFMTETNITEQLKIAWKIDQILAYELPYVYLYYRDYIWCFYANNWTVPDYVLELPGGPYNWWLFVLLKSTSGDETLDAIFNDAFDMNNPLYGNTVWDWYAWMLIYDSLVVLNVTDYPKPMPWIATWEWENETTLVFKWIYTNVTFHDGSTLDAYDWYATWKFLNDTQNPNFAAAYEFVKDVEVINKTCVKVYLREPYAFAVQSIGGMPIFPEELVNHWREFNKTAALSTWDALDYEVTDINPNAKIISYEDPVTGEKYTLTGFYGSGPYILVKVDNVNGEYLLIRNKNYFRDVTINGVKYDIPLAKRIHYFVLKEEEARLMAITSSPPQADMLLWYIPPSAVKDVVVKAGEIGLRTVIVPDLGFYYLAFNMRRYPLSDLTVRRAIAYVIDKDTIVNELLMGWGGRMDSIFQSKAAFGDYYNETLAKTPIFNITKTDTGYNVTYTGGLKYEQNIDFANWLLDQAGYKDVDGDGIREVPGYVPPMLAPWIIWTGVGVAVVVIIIVLAYYFLRVRKAAPTSA